ncbi:hypothetical protein B7494_g7363 [Chlorociboria aeruginascens]|nr:hypothetical protein B7494_g7363 [Chlorociboria aeruginascens]
MSAAVNNSEGAALISAFSHQDRLPTYLHRNIQRSLRSLTMGATVSSFIHTGTPHDRGDLSDDEEDEDPRPAKRRKTRVFGIDPNSKIDVQFNSRSHLGHGIGSESIRPSNQIQPVKPSDFYGNQHPNSRPVSSSLPQVRVSSRSSINMLLPKSPINFKKALRIDISGIVPKNPDVFDQPHKAPTSMKCRCTLALFRAKNDDPHGTVSNSDWYEAVRKTQMGVIRISSTENGEATDIILPAPFIIYSEEFYVNRAIKIRRSTESDELGYAFGFADKYSFQVWLEPVGHHKDWPPIPISSSNTFTAQLQDGSLAPNDLQLHCVVNNLFNPQNQVKEASLVFTDGKTKTVISQASHALKVDLQWSLPSHLIKVEEIPMAAPVAAPVTQAALASDTPHLGDISPPNTPPGNRARRQRPNVPTYNLKALSAQAQGRSPRGPRARRSRFAAPVSEEADGFHVTYDFGRGDAGDYSIKKQTVIMSLACPFCNHKHSSLETLRLHLNTNHSCFKISLRKSSSSSKIGFFVEVVKQSSRSSPVLKSEQRTFQLGKSMSLFDLNNFLDGDTSWVREREGPQHNTWPEHLNNRIHDSSPSSSTQVSHRSSPNTSHGPEDMEFEFHDLQLPVRPRKTFYVPEVMRPLYHTVSKRLLVAGEEIPDSDEEKDEKWLFQKHRDVILDFSDLTDDEKDYLNRWNPFLMGQFLTSEIFLPDAILRFVEANKSWFCERRSRKVEFFKQMEAFMLRGIVKQDYWHSAATLLKEAEKKEAEKEKVDVNMDEELESAAKVRWGMDCICFQQPIPPDRVVCCGLGPDTTSTMEAQPARSAVPTPADALSTVDKQIHALVKHFLPPVSYFFELRTFLTSQDPHLFSVPTRYPFQTIFPHENLNTPFEEREVKQLQYMTLISHSDRGVGHVEGNWQESVYQISPPSTDARSNTTTPNPSRDSRKPAVKMSIADYKNLKQTGIKPSPKPPAGTPESRPRNNHPDRAPGHSRNISSIATDTPMSRVPSFEGGERKNGIGANLQRAPVKDHDRNALPPTHTDSRKENMPHVNGHRDPPREPAKPREDAPRQAPKLNHIHPTMPPMKHALPPRPPSPHRILSENKPQKRALEGSSQPPEKRSKVDRVESRTPSNPKPISRKPEPSMATTPPPRSVPSSQGRSGGPAPAKSAKSAEKGQVTNPLPKSKTVNSLPPLLSPLPSDLTTAQNLRGSGFSNVKKVEERKASPGTPTQSKSKAESIKKSSAKIDSPQSSPLTTPPKSSPNDPPPRKSTFVLPRLLSPDLPDIVEQELLKLQNKSVEVKSALSSVEARHEKARQPDTPGVARKTTKPKIGHPPKRSQSNTPNKRAEAAPDRTVVVESMIVKLRYKKKQAKDIARILAMKSVPSKRFKEYEKKRLNPTFDKISEDDEDESDEDQPLAQVSNPARKRPVGNAEGKRPNKPAKKRPTEDSEAEPAPKRNKGPDSIDASKSRSQVPPAFKSPVTSTPSKNLLITPKKGDAMKSVAMRKMDSSDGHAKTPQADNTNTPASTEKARVTGDSRANAEFERLRNEEIKYTTLALGLKRKMDRYFKDVNGKAQAIDAIPLADRKLGLCIGLECVAVFMMAFHYGDRAALLRQRRIPNDWESIFGLWNFVDRNSRTIDILHGAAVQLGAISREQLNHIYVDMKDGHKDPKISERALQNLRLQGTLWRQVKYSKATSALKGLGISEVLGPWTEVREAVGWLMGVLGKYEASEKVGWKREGDY